MEEYEHTKEVIDKIGDIQQILFKENSDKAKLEAILGFVNLCLQGFPYRFSDGGGLVPPHCHVVGRRHDDGGIACESQHFRENQLNNFHSII